MGGLQKGINDLESWCLNNGEFGKQLMNEWTGLCEDDKQYATDEITIGSKKKFKWKCSGGHEWYAQVKSRTSSKSSCPYCSGHRVSNGNSLKTWCMNNGWFGEQLLSEWTGECTDGKHYKIDEVSYGSNKKFKWRCSKDHEWFAKVIRKTSSKSGCPYCSSNRVSDENNLETWCLANGSFGKQLINEWTGECKDNQHYKIYEVARASNKKFKWRCPKGHEWFTTVGIRTKDKTECPRCSGCRVSNEKNLRIWCLSNGEFGKQLISEWTGECEDGAHYSIDQVSFGSNKRFKWRCSKEHEWLAMVNSRTVSKSGCPYCSNVNRSEIASKAKLSDENKLKTWCLTNGSWGRQLIKEWTGKCTNGNLYTIDEVSYGSNKKFKWRCSKGHEWFTKVNSRTSQKQGCPYCNTRGTSYPEQFIYHSLKQIFPNTENRCKVLKSPQNPKGIEFDVGVPEIPLCIEYSPTYWHEGREEMDQYKKYICQKANVRFIQIVEDSYNELPLKMESDYICFKMDENKKDEILEVIVDHILKSLGHSISEINIELVKQKAYESSKGIEKDTQNTN